MKFTGEWLKAALIRAVRTAAQVALGMLTVGMTISQVDWMNLLSVSAVAALYSFLTSVITDLPEIGNDGTVYIEDGMNIAGINIDIDPNDTRSYYHLKQDSCLFANLELLFYLLTKDVQVCNSLYDHSISIWNFS